MAEKFLEMKSICKSFGTTQILFNIDFDIECGEVHALVGENGAGKSTLIKVLAGVHKPESGQIYINGQEAKIESPKNAFDYGISTIHQEFNLVEELDVAANIFLGREPHTMKGIIDKKKTYEVTQQLLDRISATISPKDIVKNLSVAEKQMVEICKALSIESKLLIMDEPSAVLSQKEIVKLFEIIKSLQNQGISIIYISHRLDELPVIANRCSVMRDGHMVGQLNKEELQKNRITTMMIGRELKNQFPAVDKNITDVVLKVEDLNEEGVLKDISFEVRAGEILGFSGLVGSGRTEIMRAILGVDKKTSGKIYLNNQEIEFKSTIDAKRKGVVMVPEERKLHGLVLTMSVEDNIGLPYYNTMSKAGVLSFRQMEKQTDNLIEDFNIRPNRKYILTGNMSGGNQQKVVIAKWSYQPQKVLILDEPTRGVDVGAKAEIYRIIQNIAKQGVAIIMISSDLPEILGISDRILVMREGKISGEITNKEMFTEEEVMKYAF